MFFHDHKTREGLKTGTPGAASVHRYQTPICINIKLQMLDRELQDYRALKKIERWAGFFLQKK